MKQTTKVVILLILLAATLFLTGCPKEPSVADPEGDKGSWAKKTFSYSKEKDPSYSADHNPDYFMMDPTTQTISFDFDYSEDREAAKYTDASSVEQDYFAETASFKDGYYKSFVIAPISGSFIGFEATVKKTEGCKDSGYGFMFADGKASSGKWTWYTLDLDNSSYNLRFYYWSDSDQAYVSQSLTGGWLACSEIKPLGQTNTIKVATKNDDTMDIYINGTRQGTINPPAGSATEGTVSVRAGIDFNDTVEATSSDVKIEYKFLQFQQ